MPTVKRRSRTRPYKPVYKPDPKANWGSDEYKKFYNSRQWRKVAKIHRDREPLCVVSKANGKLIPGSVTDHIIPIRFGGSRWDWRNLQTLSSSEHNKKSLAEKQRPLYKFKLNEKGEKIPVRDDNGNLILNR